MSVYFVSFIVVVCCSVFTLGLQCFKCGQYNDGVGSITPCINYTHMQLKDCPHLDQTYCICNCSRVPYIIKSLVETGKITRENAKSDKPLAGIKILDVGCGGGFLSEPLAELGAQVTGIDPCIKLIECAREHLKEREDIQQNVKYIHGTIEKFCEEQKEQFDHVVAAEILDHIQARDLFVKACVKTLKPGGTYFVSTINRTFRAWRRMVLYLEYFSGILPKGTHHWHLLVTPNETRSWLENANCAILTYHGWYQIASGDWEVCDDTTIAYYMIAMKKYEY